jgi:hypothetical protein
LELEHEDTAVASPTLSPVIVHEKRKAKKLEVVKSKKKL